PNNPTGTSVDKAQLQQIIEHFADSALVVVDEAYIEFDLANNWAMQLAQYPNLVILRTLSKAFALAGLRCGFALASQDIIQGMMKVIAPYPVPEPVAQIAAQALSKQGLLQMSRQVLLIKTEKTRMKLALADMSEVALVGDDKANFILFRTAKKHALMAHLISSGILIRDQSKQLNLENCLRITIGNPLQNKQLLAEIASFFAQQEQTT
ncbi:MAG: histidinol-phosphate aminotransferase, partial [Paraglaciecola sp.]